MRKYAALALVPLAACTSILPDPAAPAGAPCSAALLDQYVGQPATGELGARMLRENGKTDLRWVQHGMMVTMDYRADRLTVFLDVASRVERAACT